MNTRRLIGFVVDADHLNIAKSQQELTNTYGVSFHRDPPVSRLRSAPILDDRSRSGADPHPTDSELKRVEPDCFDMDPVFVCGMGFGD